MNPSIGVAMLFLIGGVKGLTSCTMITKQHKVTTLRKHQNFLTSLPLHYATDSTRFLTRNGGQPIPQNITFPLILSDDEVPPSMQSLITTTPSSTTTSNRLTTIWRKIKNKMKFDKEAIAKMGIDFGLTYNMISNVNGSFTLSAAWYIASMKTGLSPLAPGQWRSLLAAYASLYVVAALIRPFRIALAIGMTHKMEHLLQYVQKRIGCTRTNAIGMVFTFGVVLWLTCCAAGVTLASTLAGVPLWKYS